MSKDKRKIRDRLIDAAIGDGVNRFVGNEKTTPEQIEALKDIVKEFSDKFGKNENDHKEIKKAHIEIKQVIDDVKNDQDKFHMIMFGDEERGLIGLVQTLQENHDALKPVVKLMEGTGVMRQLVVSFAAFLLALGAIYAAIDAGLYRFLKGG